MLSSLGCQETNWENVRPPLKMSWKDTQNLWPERILLEAGSSERFASTTSQISWFYASSCPNSIHCMEAYANLQQIIVKMTETQEAGPCLQVLP